MTLSSVTTINHMRMSVFPPMQKVSTVVTVRGTQTLAWINTKCNVDKAVYLRRYMILFQNLNTAEIKIYITEPEVGHL